MKIKYALVSCDSNPLYYPFWPLVSKVWKNYIGIEPVLLFVGEKIPEELNEEYGKIILIKPVNDVPTSTQSQFSRLWYTQFLDDTVITTDIDMFPLSPGYFKTQIKDIPDDKFIILGFAPNNYNICYNVAKPETFKEMLNLKTDFLETILPTYTTAKEKGEEWFVDELFLDHTLSVYKGDRLVRFNRGSDPRSTRIDRSNWQYNFISLQLGMYYDCHSLRPYSQYKTQIDELLKFII